MTMLHCIMIMSISIHSQPLIINMLLCVIMILVLSIHFHTPCYKRTALYNNADYLYALPVA